MYCDLMPNSSTKYLPIYFTKESLYNIAVNEFEEKEGYKFSETSFRKFWKENHKDVKIPKCLKMGQCDACLEMKKLKQQGISKEEINMKIMEHNKLHSSARQYCDELRIKAKQQPFNILYIQFDGKQASRLPHLVPLPKETQNISRIKLQVYGASNFSDDTSHFYLFFPHWHSGPNLTISILYDRIVRFFKTIKHKRPPQLVLQIDNCAKDGKNKYIFAFAAHLVHWGWFEEVLIVSLIQGHTHDLIDQEFSTWSIGEKKYSIPSFHQIGYFISKAFQKKKTSFTILRRLYDWISYFDETLTEFHHYSNARLFKITKENNRVIMKYKTNIFEDEWHGFQLPGSNKQHGIQICSNYLQEPPHSIVPELLKEDDVIQIAENHTITKWYNELDQNFWNGLRRNSIQYLQNDQPFNKEGKILN
jgi:hypothetical protein